MQSKIKTLINARRIAGVNADSNVFLQDNAKSAGIYAARIVGGSGDLYVRIGGSDDNWQPSSSGYTDYREHAAGNGWKVWVKLAGNPPVQQAAVAPSLPIPT